MNIPVDVLRLRECYDSAVENMRWMETPPTRQSGLQVCSQAPDDELISCGSVRDLFIHEWEFSSLHPFYKDSYVSQLIASLPFQVTRLRWMGLASRGCYSFHEDLTWRLHIPLITNPEAYLLFKGPDQLHFLETGYCYRVDTTQTHTALNTSMQERVHLVGCIYD